MNKFKRYIMVLVILMLAFVLPNGVQAVMLDEMGTGVCNPGYVCNPSHFQLIGTKWQRPIFSISFNHFCGAINDMNSYMPGWGGKTEDWKIVKIEGEYNYDTRLTIEKIFYEGKIVIQETLSCNRNPWVWGPGWCAKPTKTDNYVYVCAGSQTVPLNPPYPTSLQYLPSELFAALREWEKNKETPDPLADWDPTGKPPDGIPISALSFVAPDPDQVIDKNAAYFYLILEPLPPPPVKKKVLMRWEFLQEIPPGWHKDIYVSETTYDWYSFDGPSFAWSSDFPLKVAVTPGYFADKPGRYRVQVKFESEAGWTDWRSFWIGPPTSDKTKIKKIQAMATQTQKRVISAKMVKEGKLGMKLKQTGVIVDSLAYTPAPTTPGKVIDLIITFKNTSHAVSNAALKYSVSCSVKGGGPSCPVASSTRSINKAIPAGQTQIIKLAGSTPAVAGTYEVTVKPVGGPNESGKSMTIDVGLKIMPKGTVKSINKQ